MSDSSLTTRRPIVELLVLAGPTIAQMVSYTLMQFIDRWMLSFVGDVEATVAGSAGMAFFSVLGFGFGVQFIVNTLASQAYGRKDFRLTGQFLWQGIWWGLAFGLGALVLYPLAHPLFVLMKHEPRVADLEATYFRIVLLAGWAKLVSMALGQFLLAIHRPGAVFVAALIGVIANCFFNWLLIFGHWGCPALGVAGSAWGINAAVVVETIVMFAVIATPKIRHTYNTFDFRFRWNQMKTLLRIGLPTGLQLSCDIIAWSVFLLVIISSFGTRALSANTFAFTYMAIGFMPAVGVGSAVTALVGKYIGMQRHDLAERRAHLGFAVVAVYMLLCGLGFFLFRHRLMRLFSSDPEVLRIGSTILIFMAAYQIFDALFVIYSSALRGAGDTLVPTIVQVTLVWSIVVGAGTLAAIFTPQYGVSGPWTLATLFGGILGIYLLARFRRGNWKSIQLHTPTPTPIETPGAPVTESL